MLVTLKEECTKLNYTPRSIQIKAIEWLNKNWNSENRCKVLSLPVGSGKSLVAKTIAAYNDKKQLKTAIITPQNILIDQYLNEFKDLNYLKGKEHYPCPLSQTSCAEGKELERLLKKTCHKCPYEISKTKVYDAHATLFNIMSYYSLPKLNKMSEIEYNIDTIVIDEFQSLPSMLRELITIKLWEYDIKWTQGISSSISNIINLLKVYNGKLTLVIYNQNTDVRDRVKYSKVQKRIDFIIYQLNNNSDYFICEESEEKFRGVFTKVLIIRPKYIPPSVNAGFFKIAKRVILMSGTAFESIWKELGFEEVDYIDLPSPIPAQRRQIFVSNSIKINNKLEVHERQKMVETLTFHIKDIVTRIHPQENGVILLPYNLASELKESLNEEYFIHMDKKTKRGVIEQFKRGEIYGVGVFSGSYEGLSLDDEISRFTIIPKVPYPNLQDKIVKARMEEKPLNYLMDTITTLIQASGRSTRSEKDFSFTYILDSSFLTLYPRVSKYIPKYFKESLNFCLPNENHIKQLNTFREERLSNETRKDA